MEGENVSIVFKVKAATVFKNTPLHVKVLLHVSNIRVVITQNDELYYQWSFVSEQRLIVYLDNVWTFLTTKYTAGYLNL